MRDRRPRLARRLDPARAARGEVRQAVAVVGSGPAGLACAQQLARVGPRRARLRKERQGRRPAALRHSRLQAREASRRPARRADGGRRRHLPLQRPCRRDVERRELAGRLRRGRACRRRRGVARPAGPRARPRRRPFRHGFPAAAEPPRLRRADRHQRADPRRRQERRRDRRRRHRLGLHRHLDPPGRAEGDAARDPADAAEAREQAADLAELAAQAAHLVEPRGRRGARLRRDDEGVRGRERRRHRRSTACASTTR